MNTVRMTCPKDEALSIDKNIENFCKKYMSTEEIEIAEKITTDLLSSKKKKENAKSKLRTLIGIKPKRPVFYINVDIDKLPYHTRSTVRYLGDYIDYLIKYAASEILADNACLKLSLGQNAKKLKGKIREELYKDITKYNQIIYVPAKHDFSVKNKSHLISTKEAVYILIATLNFGKNIIRISKQAEKYANDEM